MSIEVASPPTSPHRATNKVNSEISVPFNEREDKVTGEVQRSQWGNQFQFILSAVGLAVGLGNIWRFPYVAYENGGAAFLIPYLCCGLTFGLPMVYAEFMMGQYSRSGPGLVIGRYAAGFRGVGWCMTVNAISVAIYYCVIIAWAGVYLAWVFSGQSWKWTECGNWWNTARCFSQSSNLAYCGNIPQRPFYFNGTCNYIHNPSAKQAAEEFFTNYITARSSGITDIQGFNWPVLGALVFLWIITALILIKGITIMGYFSYVIVPFPYIIVCILFVRGITLKGAWLGIQYYLFKPDFSKLLHGDTWAAALKQLMFSMSIGYGGLISLSSYSKPSNNFFRDSLIVIFGDTLMSLIGGVASFSILGYLATLTNQTIDKVVSSGTALAFIVYPEAISMMSVPWLWNALFFLMLFFLGITSEIALVEVFTGMINDCFPSTKKRKWLITLLTCGGCQLAALLMVTYAGWYWFALFEEFTGSTCACVVAASEIGILSFYGWRQIKVDLIEMRGEPRYGGWKRWIGPRSPLYGIFWATVCPILAVVIAVLQLRRSIPFSIKMDDSRIYVFPVLAEIFGWFLDLGALIPIPAFFIYKWIQFRKRGIPFHYLFRPSKDLPSYDRYYKDHEMPDPEEMALRSTAVVRIPSSSGRNLSDVSPGSCKLSVNQLGLFFLVFAMAGEEFSSSFSHRASNKVHSEISAPCNGKEVKPGEVQRSQWGNQFQFILSAVGLAVGLGNIWRFPYVAYENGGAAFLIPYLCCGLTFGLPMVYAEFMMGQYSRSGPGLVIGRYAAGFRGVGWCMTVNAISVSIYYSIIIAWAGVYLAWVFSGQSHLWTECGNWWNTVHCFSQNNLASCTDPSLPYYFNGSCVAFENPHTKQAAEEFFTNYITTRSSGIGDLQGFNWPILGALVFIWLVTSLILIKGITIMGYFSYVIVPFPYIIVCILFVRGITLKGAWLGIQYYLFKPDFSKLLHGDTWAAALKQLMFSMSIGYGGLISLSSYSKPSNNFFRDSLIVIFGDTTMSLIGGVASFSILGSLATLTGQTIDKVVTSGPALAFIVYPEALSTMTAPGLWQALFFLMLFFLGVTSEIALVEVFTGMIADCLPSMKKKKWMITLLTCGTCQLIALLMATYAGFYWFSLFEEFTGSTCACIIAASEIGILSFYGWRQIKMDLIEMRGEPRYNDWKRWIGPRSPLYGISWATVCPILTLFIAVLQLRREVPFKIDIDKGKEYVFPAVAEIFGWFLNLGALLPIPAFFIYKWIQFRKRGIPFHYLFRPSKDLPSYDRYYKDRGMPVPEEMALQSTRAAQVQSIRLRDLPV